MDACAYKLLVLVLREDGRLVYPMGKAWFPHVRCLFKGRIEECPSQSTPARIFRPDWCFASPTVSTMCILAIAGLRQLRLGGFTALQKPSVDERAAAKAEAMAAARAKALAAADPAPAPAQ